MSPQYYEEIGKAVKRSKEKNGDLTTQNLLYVVKVASKLSSETGVEINDLIAVGTAAMKKMEDKYDPTKNDNFVKACAIAVRGEMMNFINRQNSIVHIPVNHLQGFKKGQDRRRDTQITYEYIDSLDYENLGECSNSAFSNEREMILKKGLDKLSFYAQKIMKMKLKMDEYANIKTTNFQFIADELELTVPAVKKIYNDAFKKLSCFCQKEI